MYSDTKLAAAVTEGFRVRDAVYHTISDHAGQADRGAVSPKGFELSARRIGRLMRENFNLGFVDVGGWDTHVNQGAGTGYLADRLGELGRGLAGFAEEILPGLDFVPTATIAWFLTQSDAGQRIGEKVTPGAAADPQKKKAEDLRDGAIDV